jgi:hypothetical protein
VACRIQQRGGRDFFRAESVRLTVSVGVASDPPDRPPT